MFQITPEQLQALEADARSAYLDRVRQMIRESLPAWTGRMSDADLRDRIDRSAARAGRYGITSERDIARFVGLSILAGPEFDEIPEVKDFLLAPVRGGDPQSSLELGDKLDYMLDWLSSRFRNAEGQPPGENSAVRA